MGNQVERFKHTRRIAKKARAIKKQKYIAMAKGYPVGPENRLSKQHVASCGDSNCAMCGNPRKFFKELTIQEKRFTQDKVEEE